MPITTVPGGHVERLRRSVDGTWRAAIEHKFVHELFADKLDSRVLANYLVQDYQFLENGISQIASLVTHADNISAKLRFARQLGFIATDEEGYFDKSFVALGVPKSAYHHPKLNEVSVEFQNEMLSSIKTSDYAQNLAMVVVAEWVYLDWAESYQQLPQEYVHFKWVELHRGDDFESWTQFLVDELERAFPSDAESQAKVSERFSRAVTLEKEFFDAAYKI